MKLKLCLLHTLSSRFQNVQIITSSTRLSVWTTVQKVTLPVSCSRSVCSVMLTVPHVMDRMRMTVMCVATPMRSDTMENAWPGVPTTPTLITMQMNAEVGKVEAHHIIKVKF